MITHYDLAQQTPLIHFQHEEEGATLRGSEVKPKLDKFILKKLGEAEWEKGFSFDKDDYRISNQSLALNYKVRFKASKNISGSHPVHIKGKGLKGIGSYFFTESEERNIMQSSFYEQIEMQIICNSELKNHITRELLCEFFAIHNFGFRQNKGFGSFIIKGTERESLKYASVITGYYLEEVSAKDNQKPFTTQILNSIDNFWKVTKNGVNHPHYKKSFLMKEYFKGHLNDKKAMKLALLNTQKFILPQKNENDDENLKQRRSNSTPAEEIKDAEYIRGLLGFAGFYSFRDIELVKDRGGKIELNFAVEQEDIKRFPAPVLFKPIIFGKKCFIYLIFRDYTQEELEKCDCEVTLQCEWSVASQKAYRGGNVEEVKKAVEEVKKLKLKFKFDKDFLENFYQAIYEKGSYKLKKQSGGDTSCMMKNI